MLRDGVGAAQATASDSAWDLIRSCPDDPLAERDKRFGPRPDEQQVYDGITADMQRVLDELSAERDLPVVGTVGSRSSENLPSARDDSELKPPRTPRSARR